MTKKATRIITMGGFILQIVLNAKTMEQAKKEVKNIAKDYRDRRIIQYEKDAKVIATEIISR
jgi:hypothetical protein